MILSVAAFIDIVGAIEVGIEQTWIATLPQQDQSVGVRFEPGLVEVAMERGVEQRHAAFGGIDIFQQ